ncbi:MAG TPA: glycosyltransferase family 2 protein [Verrucomicrobiae bacterium]
MIAPKASVLIPTYNYARYLPEAIESILGQDYQDFELLISDDCSTDNSAEVIARYAAKDNRIRFHVHPANLGMVQNWNWCLSQARGEYVKFIFGDDKLLSSSAISQMAGLMESDPAISLVASASEVIDAHSRVIETRNYFQDGVWDGKKIIVRCLERPANLIGEPTLVMFRNPQDARGYDSRYSQFVDMEMWFHLLENGKFGYLAETLCAFRQHAMQQTRFNQKRGHTKNESLQLLEEYFAKPWLRKMTTRQMLFAQIHALRRLPAAKTSATLAEMKQMLGSGWHAIFWIKHKINRCKKLWSSSGNMSRPQTVPLNKCAQADESIYE